MIKSFAREKNPPYALSASTFVKFEFGPATAATREKEPYFADDMSRLPDIQTKRLLTKIFMTRCWT